MKCSVLKTILTGLFIVFASSSLVAQQDTMTDSEKPIKVETTLVKLPLVISDRAGRRISDINKGEISVLAGTQKLDVAFFADANEPVSYAIVIDSSVSARSVIGRIKRASKQFVSFMGSEDKGLIVSFGESVSRTMDGFSSDREKLNDAINSVWISERPGSIMNDALYQLINGTFSRVKGRKAIVILTDGDVDGKASPASILKQYGQSDIAVYPIFYQTRPLFPSSVKSVTFEDLTKVEPVKYLNSLARTTGGRLLVAEADDFGAAFQQVVDELQKQYVVGFYLDADGNASAREVTIKVTRPGVVVRTKQSIKVDPQSWADHPGVYAT